MQLFGMILLPVAIAGNIAREDQVDLKTSMVISSAGVLIFLLGRLVQNAGGKKGG
jgi:hypothetical protein